MATLYSASGATNYREAARHMREAAQERREREASAPGIDGLDVAELGAEALAAFEAPPAAPPRDAEREALRERARAAVAGFTPSLRIPAGDPRVRIPARFVPVYILNR